MGSCFISILRNVNQNSKKKTGFRCKWNTYDKNKTRELCLNQVNGLIFINISWFLKVLCHLFRLPTQPFTVYILSWMLSRSCSLCKCKIMRSIYKIEAFITLIQFLYHHRNKSTAHFQTINTIFFDLTTLIFTSGNDLCISNSGISTI